MTKRRDFIKNIGLGSLAVLYPGNLKSFGSQTQEKAHFGKDIDVDFLFSGEYFLGVGNVKIAGTQLRNGERPMFVDIRNPDGVQLFDFVVLEKKATDDIINFKLGMKAKPGGTMDWMLHTVRNRQNLSDWTKVAERAEGTELELILRPVERQLGKFKLKGFTYQYKYKSTDIPIYKILDRGSWEINGDAIGNHFWMRNGVVDSQVEFSSEKDFFSTEWYLPGIANPNIFQFFPLQTALQGFTFTSAKAGTLVTWATEVSHVRSLFEKWRGKRDIIHYHEHCNDLALTLTTSPMEVLWYAGELDEVGKANLHNEVRELVHETLHRQIGMRRERIATYGVMEEWTEPDFAKYTATGLPKMIAAGVKTIFIPNQCQNVMNTWGLSNFCCNVDFKISETTGEEKLKAFCSVAKNAGVRVEMWGNTALSATTELFSHREGKEKGVKFLPYDGSIMEVIDKAKSPWVRNASNAIEADHYTPRFCALNLRDPDIRAYWMKQWKYFHDHIGIQGIFLDSSFNMSSDKFHHSQFLNVGWNGATLDQKELLGKYRPEHEPAKMIETQYHAHLEWVVEMQKMGYAYSAEDLGVFGINRTGPELTKRARCLYLWQDSYCGFDEAALTKAGFDPMDIFFKGLAYRVMWNLRWEFDKQKLNIGTENPLAFSLLKVFNHANDWMYQREILDGETGVLYSKNDTQVLWSFTDLKLPLSKRRKVTNLLTGKQSSTFTLNAKKHQVYVIS